MLSFDLAWTARLWSGWSESESRMKGCHGIVVEEQEPDCVTGMIDGLAT